MGVMFLFVRGLLAAALIMTGSAASPSSNDICDCRSVSNSFIVTRLWNIIDDDWTDQDVLDEFEQGFAPVVSQAGGFQKYAGASTGHSRTVYFMNIFKTREAAKTIQEAAKLFVRQGVLNGVITPNQFTENDLAFHYYSKDYQPCNTTTESLEGKFMGTQIWSLSDHVWEDPNSNTTKDSIIEAFQNRMAPTILDMEGFHEYGGSIVPGTDLVFFYTVFDSLVGVEEANVMSEGFAMVEQLEIYKVIFTAGQVRFDYNCGTNDLAGPSDLEGRAETSKAYAAYGSITSVGGSVMLLTLAILLTTF